MDRDSNDGLSEGLAPAFPIRDLNEHPGPWGLTLRDYFASRAMHALMRNVSADINAAEYASDIAHYSYRMADAMIERRNV